MQDYEGIADPQNIFAHELQDVLQQHGMKMEQLDDQIGIHSGKVRQLIRSLQKPDIFPVLSVDQLDLLIKVLSLSERDVARLHAAILATSDALIALDNSQQSEQQSSASQDLGNKRGGEPGSPDDLAFDRVLNPVFALIAKGNIASQKIYGASNVNKARYAREARTYFEEALAKLDRLPKDIRRNPEWRVWRQEVVQNLAYVNGF